MQVFERVLPMVLPFAWALGVAQGTDWMEGRVVTVD